jgi:hypothetical protein
VRRLLILLLFGLVLAGGAAVTWHAMGQAKLVEDDLTTARSLLARAGGFESGELKGRLLLVDQAERHTLAAQQRLGRWPLRQLGALPLVGRDVRVATAVASAATGTARATRRVVTTLEPVQTEPPTSGSIGKAADALLALHTTLSQDLERVRATRPLLTSSSRTRYLEAAGSASVTAERAGQGLKLAAGLYGPPGSARWFLAFQNPAELRGTGGLIGEYGILESSPDGPKLVKVEHYEGLNERTDEAVPLPEPVAARYERFAVGRDWTAVNIPPDMPTVGQIITQLYEKTTGDRIDGVIAADPLAVAEILRVAGPIQAGGTWMDADNVAEETLVRAYVRYESDNNARRRFLEEVARASFEAFRRSLTTKPVELLRNLGAAARGRHVQVYVADPAGRRAIAGLGLSGSAAAPATGDYLMPVGVNTGANKLDAFLRRTVRWRVRLSPDGAAQATAAFTLANDGPAFGLPRYIIGSMPGSGPARTSRSPPCTSLVATGSPAPPSTAGRWVPKPRPTSAASPSPRRSASSPSPRSPSATSSPGRPRPNELATTGCATGCCCVLRPPCAPTRPGSPSRPPRGGALTRCRQRRGSPGRRLPGRGRSTGSASWCSSSSAADRRHLRTGLRQTDCLTESNLSRDVSGCMVPEFLHRNQVAERHGRRPRGAIGPGRQGGILHAEAWIRARRGSWADTARRSGARAGRQGLPTNQRSSGRFRVHPLPW